MSKPRKRSIQSWAKYDAETIIVLMRRGEDIMAVCEQLERSPIRGDRYREIAWSTLIGAARAAARNLGRYDAVNDAILPPDTGA